MEPDLLLTMEDLVAVVAAIILLEMAEVAEGIPEVLHILLILHFGVPAVAVADLIMQEPTR